MRLLLTDLGSNAICEANDSEEANKTLNKWCLSLAPNTARKFRVEILGGVQLEFWLRYEDAGTIDIDASIRSGRWFDAADFVFKTLFNLSKVGYTATLEKVIESAPENGKKQVAAYLKRVRPDLACVIDRMT